MHEPCASLCTNRRLVKPVKAFKIFSVTTHILMYVRNVPSVGAHMSHVTCDMCSVH